MEHEDSCAVSILETHPSDSHIPPHCCVLAKAFFSMSYVTFPTNQEEVLYSMMMCVDWWTASDNKTETELTMCNPGKWYMYGGTTVCNM